MNIEISGNVDVVNGRYRAYVPATGYWKVKAAHYEQAQVEPVLFPCRPSLWLYRNKLLTVQSRDGATDAEVALRIKHLVLRRGERHQRMQQEVDAMLAIEQSKGNRREPIPVSVQMLVWRRDQDKCVLRGSNRDLEFGHTVLVSKGGSNTARNIQLECKSCNRSKGAVI